MNTLNSRTDAAREVLPNAALSLQLSVMAIVLRAFSLAILITGIASPYNAAAYDVCADDYAGKGVDSCAHEQMVEEAITLYLELAEDSAFNQEIFEYKDEILGGVGDPDEADPLYDNTGVFDGIITITHFWEPDDSFGQPMVEVLDPYANAFNVSQALWTRALGEYAAGRKEKAYTFLGMVAHFLGDQTVPAHANGDTHPENLNDGDPFEEWMSNPLLNKTILTRGEGSEYADLLSQGLLEFPPELETADKLLWLFLNVNQVADYFASDDNEGDADSPSDARYPYADGWADAALAGVIAACLGQNCPTTSAQIQDNDKNTYPYYYDIDDDLDNIRAYSYVPGVRMMGGLFKMWEEAIRMPILTLTVHEMHQTGYTDAFVCGCVDGDCPQLQLGLDECNDPDLYLAVVMGNRRRDPYPPGTLLESDNSAHSYRNLDGQFYPANVTRTDANTPIAEDKRTVTADYHFGQSFKPDPDVGGFVPGVDFIELRMQVREQDVCTFGTCSPYGDDDIALIHKQGFSEIALRIDLGKCASGVLGGIATYYFRGLPNPGVVFKEDGCAPSTAHSDWTIREGGGRGAGEDDFGADSDDVDVLFSVSLLFPDTDPPVITCAAPDGVWHDMDVSIACTAVDDGSGLEDAADGAFDLWTSVTAGTETNDALTDTREVCDTVGNCATAGPIGGNKVDKKAPVTTIVQPAATEYVHSATLVLDYTVTDNGSGVSTVTPTMNGDTMLAGNGLSSGQAIDLLTALPLGTHTFEVDADDAVGNVSPTASVTFTIIVTPDSIIDDVDKFRDSGDIDPKLVKPLLAKLLNAAKKFNGGHCTPAGNIYGAFINQVQAQTGKGITSFAAGILIADAQYLISNC